MNEQDTGHLDVPDTDDLLQEEPERMPLPQVIPVAVEGPVRTQQLACRTTSMTSRAVSPDYAETIAGHDWRRSRVLLYAAAAGPAFYVSSDRRAVENGSAALFDGGQQVELRAVSELFARSATAGTDCVLSVVLEQWAD